MPQSFANCDPCNEYSANTTIPGATDVGPTAWAVTVTEIRKFQS